MLRLLFLFSMLLFIAPTFAQDTAPECDLTPVQPALEAASEDMTLDTLIALKNEIASTQAACSGLSFSSEESGLQAVIGPVEIPAGIYRTTITTEGFFTLKLTLIEGDCGDGFAVILFQGQATDGSEAVFKSEGCRVLLETSNTSEPWTLQFELIQ